MAGPRVDVAPGAGAILGLLPSIAPRVCFFIGGREGRGGGGCRSPYTLSLEVALGVLPNQHKAVRYDSTVVHLRYLDISSTQERSQLRGYKTIIDNRHSQFAPSSVRALDVVVYCMNLI